MKKILNLRNNVVNNTIMLAIFQIAKIIFPFITLPYLTRVFSVSTYGTVTYVKTVMTYMQVFIDFGFVLSATKSIVKYKNDKNKINSIFGDTLIARLIMGGLGFAIVAVLCAFLPILRENVLFTFLSYLAVFETIFLFDYLFRGLEKMHVITIRFIVMKIISTLLTFILVKNDNNLLLIPILDNISSLVAIGLVLIELKKLNIKFVMTGFKNALLSIKESFVYFLSNAATTSSNALSTIVIGIILSKDDVAYWGICMQIIGSITACYNPITDGIYPEMIKKKNINLVYKVCKIFLPLVIIGCVILYISSGLIFKILGGDKYLGVIPIFYCLIPVLLFAFLAVLFGWPCLGAIDKNKEVTISTIVSIVFSVIVMVILIICNQFSLIRMAIIRSVSEVIMFGIRFYYVLKYRKMFNKEK